MGKNGIPEYPKQQPEHTTLHISREDFPLHLLNGRQDALLSSGATERVRVTIPSQSFFLRGVSEDRQVERIRSIVGPHEEGVSPRSRVAVYAGDISVAEVAQNSDGQGVDIFVNFTNFSRSTVKLAEGDKLLRLMEVPQEQVRGIELFNAVRAMARESVMLVDKQGNTYRLGDVIRQWKKHDRKNNSKGFDSRLFDPESSNPFVSVRIPYDMAHGHSTFSPDEVVSLSDIPWAGVQVEWNVPGEKPEQKQGPAIHLRRTKRLHGMRMDYVLVIQNGADEDYLPHGRSTFVSTHWEGHSKKVWAGLGLEEHKARDHSVIGEYYRQRGDKRRVPEYFDAKVYRVEEVD